MILRSNKNEGESESQNRNSKINRNSKDCSTLTELSTANVPEVEIVSLVEEALPQYTLQQDVLTEF